MRNISAASLEKIQQKIGTEPVLLVKVYWNDPVFKTYADRKFESDGLEGRLLEVSGIEDVVDIENKGNSTSLTITLDDSDAQLKRIYDSQDIHKVYVQVLQWFTGIPISDAFILFEGVISSPISWSEGDRKLRFDVVSIIEDIEVGFSCEEGQFDGVPISLFGKSWPLIFGAVTRQPCILFNQQPICVIIEGFAILNHFVWNNELKNLADSVSQADIQADAAYIQGVQSALQASHYKGFSHSVFPDDPSQALQYDQAAQNYFAQANQYREQAELLKIKLSQKQDQLIVQERLEKSVGDTVKAQVYGFPVTVPNQYTFKSGNDLITAEVGNNKIIILDIQPFRDPNYHIGVDEAADHDPTQPIPTRTLQLLQQDPKFRWIPGGTKLQLMNWPQTFLVGIGTINIVNVWGTTINGPTAVPLPYYKIVHTTFPNKLPGFPSLTATFITFDTPLTSINPYWTTDEISVDAIGEVGSNTADIIKYVIDNFSRYKLDINDYNHVRPLVAKYPANFAVNSRKTTTQFLKEVAFQSRCLVWLADRTFHLRYLPEKLDPVDTFNDNDVEVGSVEVTSTQTERLITKFIAQWRYYGGQSDSYEIIYRYNVQKYGIQEQTYDFYIYNQIEPVQKSAEYWMIQKSNTWKIIKFKTFLHKLKVETFDPVEINFSERLGCDVGIVGIVQSAVYNSDDNTIAIEVKLPVVLGTMFESNLAFPLGTATVYPFNEDPNINTGNPYEQATGNLIVVGKFPTFMPIVNGTGFQFTAGRGVNLGDANDVEPVSVITAVSPTDIAVVLPPADNYPDFNKRDKVEVQPVQPFQFTTPTPATLPGLVTAKVDDTTYKVNVYANGLDGDPTEVITKLLKVPSGSTLSVGYPLMVHRLPYKDKDGKPQIMFFSQPPLWVPDDEE